MPGLLDYNTRVVLAGTLLLGVSAGVVGTFMLLRKRALVGDVASHAALPGIGLAYLLMEQSQPGSGKWLPGLLVGAAATATAGLLLSQGLRQIRRIQEDAALGITLGLFFGAGVALFTLIQTLPTGQAAGLNDFIFGKAAALLASDVAALACMATVVIAVCAALHKELGLLCFDAEYALAGGWPVGLLDLVLTVLVIAVTVLGMQSVGLLLVVALLVLPPTAARFWTDRLSTMVWTSAGLGGLACASGVLLSAAVPKLAAGAVIVLMGSGLFVISLLWGRRHGLYWTWRATLEARRRMGLDDLLRAGYEVIEPKLGTPRFDPTRYSFSTAELLTARRWSAARVRGLIRQAVSLELLREDSQGTFQFTESGKRQAERAVRNHRLWELYLIHFAAVAPTHVDRSADAIEHVLRPEIVEQLADLLDASSTTPRLPGNPHSPTT
uniref:Iron ABC transporter n=1 Tax=Schlesneria paludicola TaxID=360056 RepID=A0A7C4LPZ3_9PLAN